MTNRFSMGTHQGGNDVCLTPPHIIQALGLFDLDPAAAPNIRDVLRGLKSTGTQPTMETKGE